MIYTDIYSLIQAYTAIFMYSAYVQPYIAVCSLYTATYRHVHSYIQPIDPYAATYSQ